MVIKGVIPKEDAAKYAEQAFDYLESFGLGFDRTDPSTFVPEKMPHYFKGGLIHRYGTGHEQFAWDIR